MSQRILIVEDEPEFAELMALWLRRAGYETIAANGGVTAMRAFYQRRPDLITLDVSIPQLDGWQVCQRVREVSSVPILIVSARGGETDRIRGLELGADDYITKPFAFRELVARVAANLRRAYMPPGEPSELLRHRGLVIDRQGHRVLLEGSAVHLTPTEFQILVSLAERPGQLVSHEQLLHMGWGSEYATELPLLRTAIRSLRAKLEAAAPGQMYIATDYGLGYRLASVPSGS